MKADQIFSCFKKVAEDFSCLMYIDRALSIAWQNCISMHCFEAKCFDWRGTGANPISELSSSVQKRDNYLLWHFYFSDIVK